MRRSSLHVSSEMLVTGSTRTTRGHVPSLYHLKVLLTADVIQSSRCTAAAFIISPKIAAHRSDAAAPNKQMMFRYIYIYLDGRVTQVAVNTAAGRIRREKLRSTCSRQDIWFRACLGGRVNLQPAASALPLFFLSSRRPAGVSGGADGCLGVEHLSCSAVAPPVCVCQADCL